MKDQKGFTLIEIIIVSTILAVLVALGVATAMQVVENANKGVCINNQKTLYQTTTLYALETGANLDNATFPDIEAVRETLCPGGEDPEGYLKDWALFDCPSDNDESYNDYYLSWEGETFMGFVCLISEDHNKDALTRRATREVIRRERRERREQRRANRRKLREEQRRR